LPILEPGGGVPIDLLKPAGYLFRIGYALCMRHICSMFARRLFDDCSIRRSCKHPIKLPYYCSAWRCADGGRPTCGVCPHLQIVYVSRSRTVEKGVGE